MAGQVDSQFIGIGSCPDTANATAINTTKYISRPWFYSYSILNLLELFDECSRQDITQNSDGTLTSIISAVFRFLFISIPREIPATVKINTAGNGGTEYIYDTIPIKYVIICTDYDNYAIAYSCTSFSILNLLTFNYKYSWILVRTRTVDALTLPAVTSCLARYGISQTIYTRQDQTNCFN